MTEPNPKVVQADQARVERVAVTVREVHVSDRRMTKTVFRQIPEADPFTEEATSKGDLWGRILDQHKWWVLWSADGALFRCHIPLDESFASKFLKAARKQRYDLETDHARLVHCIVLLAACSGEVPEKHTETLNFGYDSWLTKEIRESTNAGFLGFSGDTEVKVRSYVSETIDGRCSLSLSALHGLIKTTKQAYDDHCVSLGRVKERVENLDQLFIGG